MNKDELLEHLRGHGNHLALVKGTSHDELARGVGLTLLALKELLEGTAKEQKTAAAASWLSHRQF